MANFSKILKRYPGSSPFRGEQRRIFFGRETDIERLYTTIEVNPLVVLHGKSGLGKTSLMMAGVAPLFTEATEQRGSYLLIAPRFFPHDGQEHVSALREIKQQLLQFVDVKDVFLKELGSDAQQLSLWQINKSIEKQHADKAGILILFDQCEELFSYPPEEVDAFAAEFSELALNRMPADFQQKLYKSMGEMPNFMTEHEAELSRIEQPMILKIVIGIRSDRMSFVDRLKPWLPGILKATYELQPLTRTQAEAAIVKPAQAEGEFSSPPFKYEPTALSAILDFLTSESTKPVETTQLQVICQYAENLVHEPQQTVLKTDLGDIGDIYQNHYNFILTKFPPDESDRIRKMIEEGLIFEEEERRLSLFERQILLTYRVDDDSLRSLVDDFHLLRVEPMASGGFSYELSHDSLVKPILVEKRIRVEKNRREAAVLEKDKEQKDALEREQSRRIRQERYLYGTLLLMVLPLLAFAIYKYWQTNKQSKELETANQQLAVLSTAEALRAEKLKLKNDSLDLTIDQLYRQEIELGDFMMAQKEYLYAQSSFEKALQSHSKLNSPESVPAIAQKIRECIKGEQNKQYFLKLMAEGEQLFNNNEALKALPLFKTAMTLNHDNSKADDKITLCQRELLFQLSENLRRAEVFLTLGDDPKRARETLATSVEPLLEALQVTDSDLLDRRNKLNNLLKKRKQ
jgi:hypothetical protein